MRKFDRFDDDARPPAERHRPVGVEAAARYAHHRAGVVPLVEPVAEEVPQRGKHGGFRFIIPVHLEGDAPQVVGILARDSDPDPLDHSWARDVEQHGRVPGGDLEPIAVASGRVVGRNLEKATRRRTV